MNHGGREGGHVHDNPLDFKGGASPKAEKLSRPGCPFPLSLPCLHNRGTSEDSRLLRGRTLRLKEFVSLGRAPRSARNQARTSEPVCLSLLVSPFPHCLLGTDNLYVNNNVNGHLIHQADSTHIPLRQPPTPINHHKAARKAAPHSSCECSSPRLLPSRAVIFLHGARPIPEEKRFNGQNRLVQRRTGVSFLAHHLKSTPSSQQ